MYNLNYLLYIFYSNYLIFHYWPIYGLVIAFKKFNAFKGMLGSPWVGFQNFTRFFSSVYFGRLIKNTVGMNLYGLAVSFPAPIILAILLTEIRIVWFKRLSQTILYLPHFISWVVIGGIMYQLLSTESGYVNIIIKNLGGNPIPFLTERIHWIISYVLIGVWQSAGWGSILYLATITSIPPELYEAAMIDGAGWFKQILHITLPGIRQTIVVMLILSVGRMLAIGFDRPYVIGNVQVRDIADVISTFVYRIGLQSSNYSLATAVGLFQSEKEPVDRLR
jgi:putative aldouronate transport system permease protein